MRDLLNVLEVCEDFDQFVPDSVGEVLRLLDVVDLQELLSHVGVYLLQVFRHKKLNDKHILLHIPAASLLLLVEVLLASLYESLTKGHDPRLDSLWLQLIGNGVIADNDVHYDNG